jgi:magnesium-protoporphyrin IX monomethyl ester (oxidative) cyclase
MMARHKAGVTLDAVRESVALIHEAGLRAKGLFIFGLPGETPETFRATSDFILSLDLDEMNMTEFCPMYGAPIWEECVSGRSGDFHEDWRLMNCMNSVFKPHRFQNREEMDALYNWHVRRFYDSKAYHRRFAKRLLEHRWSLWHAAKHSLRIIQAARFYSKTKAQNPGEAFPLHPRQPRNLTAITGG